MNIFVAKLSYDTTTAELQAVFEPFGDVDSVKVIMDRETGRSKGYGFVEMPNNEEAITAIAALNETELDGRTILVKESTPQGQRRPRRDNRGGGGYGGGGGGYRPRNNDRGGRYDRDDRYNR